ncbi:hypothetical protein OTERR_12700 [Oryzomicrobium terrae]|uniref:RsaL-like HTH domain-containing protein n=1 Tax=Oryzomicrobium terrae TaxID=1735038 RepID=A0A5C1E739_9RHOO|nr:helix-turn-helix transcriptional regulator [Oryzomicrobium terrae]QEL64746.1 hypothetical protein OTERR_12700 [Oryzomicrobium terrae]
MENQINGEFCRDLRQRKGLNQGKFWSAVHVTQSCGSRYETGRDIPEPVATLVRLVHVEGIDLAGVTGKDVAVAKQLKEANPKLYKELAKDAAKAAKAAQ